MGLIIGPASKQVEWQFNPYTSLENQREGIPLPSNSSVDVVVSTVYDAVTRIHSDVDDEKLKSIGLLPSVAVVSDYDRMREIHNVFYRLLLNPSFELCSIINSYTRLFQNKHSIGVQIRMGGNMSNTKDATFMNTTRVMGVMNELRRIISMKEESNVVLFISADSSSTVDYFRASLQNVTIISVKEFTIGHSATAFGKRGDKEKWEEATKRAIVDLMILKECDELIITRGSSFGDLAASLQQSHYLSVTLEPFLREKGLKCSTFHRRKSVGVFKRLFLVFTNKQNDHDDGSAICYSSIEIHYQSYEDMLF